VLAVAAVYYGAAKLGLSLAFETPSVTAIWAPTGIALAAVLILGYRIWPGIALGALLANAWTGVPFYAVLGITLGNSLEALTGAYLLRRVADFRISLERPRDVLALALLAGGLSTMVSASIGVSSLLAAGEVASGELGSVWRTWWLGDMGGDLVVAPALLVAVTHWPFRRAPGRLGEAVLLALTTLALSYLVFSQEQDLAWLIFPALAWAALRFWQPGAAAASLLIAAVAVPLTEADMGPFAGTPPDERLLLAQTFIGVAGVSALLLAAVTTERRRAEEAVERIAGTLQESLLPSRLPSIPGLEVSADFRPAGERHIVGGDFYDLFENDDGSWATVVGDVCGKGAPAAALTGLARYTLRAAAVDESRPSRILGVLNDAILRQAPNELCTVAFARIERDSGGVWMTVSIGGHPPPLVLRESGVVEEAGRNGTVLGVVPEPELSDHEVELRPGDAVVLYTDGLTDAHAPARIVTQAELISLLESCAGMRGPELVEAIERGAVGEELEGVRDDIAVLVVRVEDS
jgi:integral membrane sensor domain MASE1/serine phosphatase RsbU (regulator of sigma subunit)